MARTTGRFNFFKIILAVGSTIFLTGLYLVLSNHFNLESLNTLGGLTIIALGLFIDLLAKKIGDYFSS